ncbi:MAG: hypothetical protein K2M00_08290, partial [Muribaculaceae bacterium]|nr:hypothetical protein [Muribaculaceae bacterium]
RVPALLDSRAELRRRLESSGVDSVIFLDFTPELMSLTAAGFMDMIHSRYGVDVLLMGYDNTLGSDRLKDEEAYREAGRVAGVEVVFNGCYRHPATGVTPASSLLRKYVGEGRVEDFTLYTGRRYRLEGTVVHGRRNGHKLGFPTINLDVAEGMCIPSPGVYVGRVIIGPFEHPAVINVGNNPTVTDGSRVSVEGHVPGEDLGELYGAAVAFEFHGRLRGERRFADIDGLRSAIQADIEELNRSLDTDVRAE